MIKVRIVQLVFKVIFNQNVNNYYMNYLYVLASSTGPFIQYSFQQVNSVVSNMTLTFDTLAGTYNRSYMYIK